MEKIKTQDVYLPEKMKDTGFAICQWMGEWQSLGDVEKHSNMIVLTKQEAVYLIKSAMLEQSMFGTNWYETTAKREEYINQLFGKAEVKEPDKKCSFDEFNDNIRQVS